MPFDSSYILILAAMGLSWLVSKYFQSVMGKLSKMPTSSGMTGKEIAERMLADYGVTDVKVIAVQGQLTDHYHPTHKTVNLSEAVYNQRSVVAAAVAAHECGHAIQHNVGYSFLKARSALVPMVMISGKFSSYLIMGGFFISTIGAAMGGIGYYLLLAGVVLLGVSTLFSIITLPVEFDASNRALAWIEREGITRGEEHKAAKKGLKWAAMTYVAAALSSLASLLYYARILMQMSNRR